jgi:hypothetical protein
VLTVHVALGHWPQSEVAWDVASRCNPSNLSLQAPSRCFAPQAAPHTIQRGMLPAGRLQVSAQAAAYQTATEPPPTSAPFKPRVFADYSIYKGKGALSLKVTVFEQCTCSDIGTDCETTADQLVAHLDNEPHVCCVRPSSRSGRRPRQQTLESIGLGPCFSSLHHPTKAVRRVVLASADTSGARSR